jgi:uncharacterized membrane protein YedE/YeeE
MNPLIFTGLGVGIVFGFALQRGRFCMNSASRDVILLKDNTMLKAVGVALLVQLIGFAIMNLTGIAVIAPKPFWWGANLIGSFVFGIGMVLAGGCASGITYRTGEGMVGAMTAAVGLAISAYLTGVGFLKPIAASLQESTVIKTADGANLTLANMLGVPYSVLAIGIAVVSVVIWWAVASKNKVAEPASKASLSDRIFKRGWDWLPTGIVIGLIAIVAFPLSVAAGRNYPLGITDGWLGLVNSIFFGKELGWSAMLIVGIILGALIAALIAGEFKFRVPSVGTLVQTFIGGLLMGFGATCSGGCNIGHVLSGLPQLALGSILAAIAIVLGAWLTAYLMFMRRQTV